MDTETLSKTWQQPTSRIKLKVKKRRPSKSSHQIDNQDKANTSEQDRVVSVKRNNPFGCSAAAKRRPSNTTNPFDNKLFQALDGQIDGPIYPKVIQSDTTAEIFTEKPQSLAKDEETTISHEDNDETTQEQQQQNHIFPIDWSLKTRARFTSPKSFNWTGSLKSAEIANSITRFVRCCDDGDSSPSTLNSACNFWMHPSLPSMQLFPRHSSTKKYDEDIVSGLQKDWVSSFHSLFNLLRCGHCGYFYVCAGHCTMLFMADNSGISAIITPTTKGLRDALDREGIEYSLPHDNPQDNSATSDDDDDKENDSDDDDNDEWMKSIGIDKEQFPSLEKHTKQQTIDIRNKDQHPSSTVMVTGSDTLALSNFILNWKAFTTGIPPTLLSPVAFEGATLRSHKITQGIVKHRHDKDMKQVHSLEVTGAILPGSLQRISHVIKTLHNGPFTVTLTPHQCTVPLNISDRVYDVTSLEKAGMTTSELDYFTATNKLLDRTCLKEIKYDGDGLWSWK